MKIISLFNHKGGVSKTTTSYNLGWMFANLGKKVLLVDADAQCNLTGIVLGDNDKNLFSYYNDKSTRTIYDGLADAFGFNTDFKNLVEDGMTPTPTKNNNLYIIAGHIDFADFDGQITTGILQSKSLPSMKKNVGAIYNLIKNTSIKNNIDIVIVDLSPSISMTNLSILMSSDYFIIPTTPDFYCLQAIKGLPKTFDKWISYSNEFKDDKIMPKKNPKLLGFILQNYRIYSSKKKQNSNNSDEMTKGYKEWFDRIKNEISNNLVPFLQKREMIIDEKRFKEYIKDEQPYTLKSIQDFNSPMAYSQIACKPVFELTKDDINLSGHALDVELKQVEKAKNLYETLAKSILGLID